MENSDTIVESRKGNIKIVRYNKPEKKNAIDKSMYKRVTKILIDAKNDPDIAVVVLTGTGDYYSSGNDLVEAMATISAGLGRAERSSILEEYIYAFIEFPKILVAVVNGPAIGIAATTLPLCDLVFASENSYLYTPFTKLGIVPEGASSYTFPRLIGDRKSAEMLLFNHKMSANEALSTGFINYVYKPDELESKVWGKIMEISSLPQQSVIASKQLLRRVGSKQMVEAYKVETVELNKMWTSDEFLNNLISFLNKKSKV